MLLEKSLTPPEVSGVDASIEDQRLGVSQDGIDKVIAYAFLLAIVKILLPG